MNLLLLLVWLNALEARSFTLAMPVSPETVEGQRLIAQRAAEICRGRYPRLGRYRFSGQEEVAPDGSRQASFEVEQELACVESPSLPPTGVPVPDDWRPSREDQGLVTALTQQYFASIDAGDAEGVHALWSAEERAAVPLPRRASDIAEFRRRAGVPAEHVIVRLTWYVNPENAPSPGVYAAVDYERRYSGLLVNCGYLIWFREGEGSYVITREETNIVERGGAEISPESLAQARSLMGCEGR